MKRKKILIIGFSLTGENETRRIHQECIKRKICYEMAIWKHLRFDMRAKRLRITTTSSGADIREFQGIWARSPHASSGNKRKDTYLGMSRLYDHFTVVSEYATQHNVYMLNQKVTHNMPSYNKFFQYIRLQKAGLSIIPSVLSTSEKTVSAVTSMFQKPFIAKGIYGSKGRNVFKIKSAARLQQLIKRYGFGQVMVQEYIPIDCDYRVMIVGEEIIGSMKRTMAQRNFRTNFSAGGSVQSADISVRMKQIAQRATHVFKAEVAGVDILEHQGRYYIIEVNFFPGFTGFEKATRINVAGKIIEYLLQKI